MLLQKPLDADIVKNNWCPQIDKMAVCYSFSDPDDVGTTVVNQAPGKRANWDADITGPTWTRLNVITGEGTYFSATDGRILGPLNGDGRAWVYPRGSIFIRARSTAGTLPRHVFALNDWGTGVGHPGAFRLELLGSANQMKFRFRDNADVLHTLTIDESNAVGDSSGDTEDGWVNCVVSWGEKGLQLYSTGRASPDNQITPSDAVQIPDGVRLVVADRPNLTHSDVDVSAFYWYDWQLSERERNALFADPHLPTRRGLTGTDLLGEEHGALGAVAGRVTATSAVIHFPGRIQPHNMSSSSVGYTTQLRVRHASDEIMDTDVRTSDVVEIDSAASRGVEIVLSGLPAFAARYWIAEYSTDDGTTWYPFVMPVGRVKTQSTSAGDTLRILVVADWHAFAIAVDSAGLYGLDNLVGTSNDDLIQRRCDRTLEAIRNDGQFDFILDVGDTGGQWRLAEPPMVHLLGLFAMGAFYPAIGNHEEISGFQQDITDVSFNANTPRERENQIAYAARFPLIYGATYPEGGENEPVPIEPQIGQDYVSNVDWIPDIADAGGDEAVAYFDQNIYEFPNAGNHEDKLGINQSPFGNYYAMTHGPALFIVLDPYRYTAPGSDEHNDQRTVNDWTYGPAQMKWLKDTLSRSSAKWKFIITHAIPGGTDKGLLGNLNSTGFYCRTSGFTKAPSAPGVSFPECHERLFDLCLKYKVTAILKGHDHGGVHYKEPGSNLHVITIPPAGANSVFVVKNRNRSDWFDYGFPNSGENNVLQSFGKHGYAVLEISGQDSAKLVLKQSLVDHHTLIDQSNIDDDLKSFASRHLGEVFTVDANNRVTLPDVPTDVLGVFLASDSDYLVDRDDTPVLNAANWPLLNRYDPDSQAWPVNANESLPVPDLIEPHLADGSINVGHPTGSSSSGQGYDPHFHEGDQVRVEYAPRTLATIEFSNAGTPKFGTKTAQAQLGLIRKRAAYIEIGTDPDIDPRSAPTTEKNPSGGEDQIYTNPRLQDRP